jgi:hypothetical protein
MTPYEEGWDCGYNNLMIICPYILDSTEYNEWQHGYWQDKWIDGIKDTTYINEPPRY